MVGIVECAVIADEFGLGERGRLLVAILRSGHEGLETSPALARRCVLPSSVYRCTNWRWSGRWKTAYRNPAGRVSASSSNTARTRAAFSSSRPGLTV